MKMKATDILTPEQFNKLIKYLKKQIPLLPDLTGRTVTYDYDSENMIISVMWDSGYFVSEDHVLYILDLDQEGKMIGVERLDFSIEEVEKI